MESVYSSPSLLNEYLWYDKLLGPSQRVVTLCLIFHLYDFVNDFFPIVQTFLNSGCWKDDGHPLSVQLHVLFQEEAEDHLQGTTWVRLC